MPWISHFGQDYVDMKTTIGFSVKITERVGGHWL